jgi:hypothetical protein
MAIRSHVKPEATCRLTSNFKGSEHHVTIPAHKDLRIGTLSAVLAEVASYLETEREKLIGELFG